MSVITAFAEYLESLDVATRGRDLFTSRAPSSKTLKTQGYDPDRIFWVKAAPGAPPERSITGEARLGYGIDLYHRDLSADAVADALESVSDQLTCAGCSVTLDGYDVHSVEVEGPWTDQDLDDEERTLGLLQVTITINKEC